MDMFAEYRRSVESIMVGSDEHIEVPKHHFTFKRWNGAPIADSYRKPVLDWHGEPLFAELIVLQLLRQYGFDGIWWVDNFRCRFRQSMEAFLVPLEPSQKAALKDREIKRVLPMSVLDVYGKVIKARGCRKGFWDVLAWKGTEFLFAECKWKGHDSIKPDQGKWLKAAQRIVGHHGYFVICEWELETAS